MKAIIIMCKNRNREMVILAYCIMSMTYVHLQDVSLACLAAMK